MANHLVDMIREVLRPNRDRHGIPALDGAMRPNDRLENAPALGTFEAPDDVLAMPDGGVLVSTGKRVVQLSGKDAQHKHVLAEFSDRTGGLGRHPDGHIMVCVEGRGVAILAADGAQSWLGEADGAPILCANAVLADAQGRIFVTDGSRHNRRSDWKRDLLEKRSSGRLIVFDTPESPGRTLLEGLAHPGGLCLSVDGDRLVLGESWGHCLTHWPLADISARTASHALPNLPGYPGRLCRAQTGGGYWLALFALRTELVELVLKEDAFRLDMLAGLDTQHWIAPALVSGRDPYEMVQMGAVSAMGQVKPWAPPHAYGLILRLDEDFQPRASLHSRVGGTRHGITGLSAQAGRLLAVSKGHGALVEIRENTQ